MAGEDDPLETLSFCVAASFLVSGGFDRTVAIWDVGEGYRKLSLKVPMPVLGGGSGLHSLVIPFWVLWWEYSSG